MSLLILKASVAHTAITNVIINNKVIVYSFVILYFFLRCKITIVCAHRQDFLTKREEKRGFVDIGQGGNIQINLVFRSICTTFAA